MKEDQVIVPRWKAVLNCKRFFMNHLNVWLQCAKDIIQTLHIIIIRRRVKSMISWYINYVCMCVCERESCDVTNKTNVTALKIILGIIDLTEALTEFAR